MPAAAGTPSSITPALTLGDLGRGIHSGPLVSPISPPPASNGRDAEEVEWQFTVDDLVEAERALRAVAARSGLRLTPAGERELRDQYLDTGDWAFHRAGFPLRLRSGAGAAEATLKSLAEDNGDGPRRRREVTEELVAADRLALLTAEGPVTERVRAVAGPRTLRPLFTVTTHRRAFELRSPGFLLAAVVLDDTRIERSGDGPVAALRRVEVELSGDGPSQTVESFARSLRDEPGIAPAGGSKFAAGLSAAALEPATAPDFGPIAYDRDSTIAEVAYAALRRHFAAYLANEPGTRLGEDIEALHDMRVSSRRLRTALRLFAPFLPDGLLDLDGDLRWVTAQLGVVRDLDVQFEWLRGEADAAADPAALAPAVEHLDAMRDEARAGLLAALDSKRHAALVEALSARLPAGQLTLAGVRLALAVAPRLLRRRYRRLRRAVEGLDRRSPDAAYHEARIRSKRLRYATEFVAGLYGKPARRVIRVAKDAQDELGRRQDAAIAIERLRALASAEPPLPAATVFAMGELAERERHAQHDRAVAFDAIYRRLRKRWARLNHAFERR